jgi:transposase
MSPIENIWGIIKDRIWERASSIESIDELKKIIKNIFKNDEGIRLATKNCYTSMPKRIAEVLERNGRSCGY